MEGLNGHDAAPTFGLYANEERIDLSARKSLKVRIPIGLHVKLHALKLLGERGISETVEKTLDLYFARMRELEPAARAGSRRAPAPPTTVQGLSRHSASRGPGPSRPPTRRRGPAGGAARARGSVEGG